MNAWTWPPTSGGAPTSSQVAKSFYANPGGISLAVPPIVLGKTPGAADAEFDSDPGWVYFETLPGGPVVQRPFSGSVDFNARIAGVAPAIDFTRRKSFVTLQPGNNSAAGVEGLYCNPVPITWQANQAKWYWCGGGTGYEYVSDTRRSLCLMAISGGLPDRNNQVCVGNTDPGGPAPTPLCAYSIAGGGTATITGGVPSNDPIHVGAHMPYIGFYLYSAGSRSGLGGEGWAWNDFGQKVRLGVLSFPNVLTATYFVGFLLRTPGASPLSGLQMNIFQADFFRESIGVTPPWTL
jgi:hypothetical protein